MPACLSIHPWGLASSSVSVRSKGQTVGYCKLRAETGKPPFRINDLNLNSQHSQYQPLRGERGTSTQHNGHHESATRWRERSPFQGTPPDVFQHRLGESGRPLNPQLQRVRPARRCHRQRQPAEVRSLERRTQFISGGPAPHYQNPEFPVHLVNLGLLSPF